MPSAWGPLYSGNSIFHGKNSPSPVWSMAATSVATVALVEKRRCQRRRPRWPDWATTSLFGFWYQPQHGTYSAQGSLHGQPPGWGSEETRAWHLLVPDKNQTPSNHRSIFLLSLNSQTFQHSSREGSRENTYFNTQHLLKPQYPTREVSLKNKIFILGRSELFHIWSYSHPLLSNPAAHRPPLTAFLGYFLKLVESALSICSMSSVFHWLALEPGNPEGNSHEQPWWCIPYEFYLCLPYHGYLTGTCTLTTPARKILTLTPPHYLPLLPLTATANEDRKEYNIWHDIIENFSINCRNYHSSSLKIQAQLFLLERPSSPHLTLTSTALTAHVPSLAAGIL